MHSSLSWVIASICTLSSVNVDVNSIIARWRACQGELAAGAWSWSEQRTLTKGSILPAFPGAPKAIVPPTNISQDFTSNLSLDGHRLRYTWNGPSWSFEQERFVSQEFVSVFDEGFSTTYMPPGVREYGFATVVKTNIVPDAKEAYLLPLLLCIRPLDARIGPVRADALQLLPGMDQDCFVIKEQRGSYFSIILVDPNKGFSILKYSIVSKEGQTRFEVNLSQKYEERHGWLPSSWTIRWFESDGTLREETTAAVREHSVGPLNPSVFRIPFPVDTWVYDRSTKRDYIVRNSGVKRIILPEELTASYAQIRDTETGEAVPSRSSLWKWVLGINLCAAAVLIITALWKYSYKLRKKPPPEIRTVTDINS